jgi:PadR family transcriptional regulator, regulatory protein PadR
MILSKDLVAASAVPLLLGILAEAPSYGYAIARRVRELSGDEIRWSEGMLYPVLHRLEEQGSIESSWQESETGRRRRYYHITAAGHAELDRQREQWELVRQTLDRAWKPDR